MTVIRPNSITGITSITAQANEINVFRSNGLIAGLNLNGVNFNTTAGISTLAALKITGNLDVAGVLTYQDVTNVDSLGIGTFRVGVNVPAGQLDVGSNIKLGNAGVITATSFVGSGAQLTGITQTTINNNTNNYVVTATGTANTLQGEANLVFDGTKLGVGVVPTAQYAHNLIQIGHQATLGANAALSATGQTFLTHNLYFDTGGTLRVFNTSNANEGAIFRLVDGQLLFSNSAATTGTPTVTERFRITSAGDFGTNGVTPTTQAGRVFHLHAGSDQQRFHMTNSTTGSGATDGFEILIDQDSNANCRIRNFEAGYMAFDTGGSSNEVMRLDSSGRVMIGSTSAEAKLDVTGGVSISSNGVTVSPSGYDLKIRSNTGKLGIHIDNSSGTPTLEFGTGNATTGGAITTNNHGIFLKPGNVDKLKVEPDGVRSFATFVDTSYHANPDPLGDGSGIAYYRLNYNFQDSGLFANHGQGIQGGDPTFALVNSSGEPCWNNPSDGAINLPNLKNSYPFSMAAWINVSSWPTSADNDLIMNLSIGGQRVSLSICCFNTAVSDGADFYIMYGGTGHHYFRPSSKPTNTWIHVVYSVVDSNNTSHRVYQNGADLTTRGNRGGGHGGNAGWAIGGNAQNSERFAIGRIGSIRFFNKALSSSEASALYTNDTFYT